MSDIKEEPEPTSPKKAGQVGNENERPNGGRQSSNKRGRLDVIGVIDDEDDRYDENVRKMNENIGKYYPSLHLGPLGFGLAHPSLPIPLTFEF